MFIENVYPEPLINIVSNLFKNKNIVSFYKGAYSCHVIKFYFTLQIVTCHGYFKYCLKLSTRMNAYYTVLQ